MQVGLENHRVHGLRRHVDDVRPRVAQPHQEEQQAFFVERHSGQFLQLVLVQRERRDDHRRAMRRIRPEQRLPDLREPGLQLLERGQLLFECEIARKRGLGNHGRLGAWGLGRADQPGPLTT